MNNILQNGIYDIYPETGKPPINFPNISNRGIILVFATTSHTVQQIISWDLEVTIRMKINSANQWTNWKKIWY